MAAMEAIWDQVPLMLPLISGELIPPVGSYVSVLVVLFVGNDCAIGKQQGGAKVNGRVVCCACPLRLNGSSRVGGLAVTNGIPNTERPRQNWDRRLPRDLSPSPGAARMTRR